MVLESWKQESHSQAKSWNEDVDMRSFAFKEAWEWNKLPVELKEFGSVGNF